MKVLKWFLIGLAVSLANGIVSIPLYPSSHGGSVGIILSICPIWLPLINLPSTLWSGLLGPKLIAAFISAVLQCVLIGAAVQWAWQKIKLGKVRAITSTASIVGFIVYAGLLYYNTYNPAWLSDWQFLGVILFPLFGLNIYLLGILLTLTGQNIGYLLGLVYAAEAMAHFVFYGLAAKSLYTKATILFAGEKHPAASL